MPSAEEMRELAQEIVASQRSRRQDIASLKHETHALMNELAEGSKARQMGLRIQLTGFRNDHQAMGEEVRAELAKVRPELEADNAALMADLAKTTKARKQDVRSQLRGYDAEMKAAQTAWQEGLRAAPRESKPRPPARRTPPGKATSPKKLAR